jgi:hypothetical protein
MRQSAAEDRQGAISAGYGWSWPLLLWYFQGWLTPAIAVLAVIIAWQQWRTAAQKLKMDLIEKRYRVYEAVKKVVVSMFT